MLRTKLAIHVVVASGAESRHQGLVSAFAECHNGNACRLGVTMNDSRQIERIHFSQIGGAQNRGGSIPFQHGQCICSLGAVRYFHTFLFHSVRQAFRKKHVAVDQKNLRRILRTHARTSAAIRRSRSSTSTISSFNDSNPDTYGGSLPFAGRRSASASSHSPVTGTAARITLLLSLRCTMR